MKDHVLSQAYTQFNTHIAILIEPLMATLDATSLKNLPENREIQIVSVETMTGTFKKRARVKKVLHRLLVEHKIVPAQDLKGNASVLHAHKDVKVRSVVDMCVKDVVGQTLIRQYYSPPADVKLDQASQAGTP